MKFCQYFIVQTKLTIFYSTNLLKVTKIRNKFKKFPMFLCVSPKHRFHSILFGFNALSNHKAVKTNLLILKIQLVIVRLYCCFRFIYTLFYSFMDLCTGGPFVCVWILEEFLICLWSLLRQASVELESFSNILSSFKLHRN